MADESPDYYKRLYLEEQCKRREEQRRREEEQRRREEEQRRREAAELAQEKAEEKTRKTTLPEFLDACHVHLHSGLAIQTDDTLSTRGDPANAKNKLRPEAIIYWADFPERQAKIWDSLMKSTFVSERTFTSLHTIQESGETVRRRMMASELDLHVFSRTTVENQVSEAVHEMYRSPELRRAFQLQGSITFENHSNTLSPDSHIDQDMERLTISKPRRRSPRLQAVKAKEAAVASHQSAAAAPTRASRPRADQFCVYNASTEDTEIRKPAFAIEYKAPHKLPLSYIYEGLEEDINLEEVIQCENNSPRDRFRQLVAAVITQAFSYMVALGVEFGCVCTGEAYIFLRVPEDPTMVQYYLSVPKGDVGETTGWKTGSDNANRLHLTAIGQMLAFTLQALKAPLRSQGWRAQALAQLNSWEVVFEDVFDNIPEGDAISSEYRPPRHDGFLRMSPIKLRKRPTPTQSPSCLLSHDQHESTDEGSEPDTPSRHQQVARPLSRMGRIEKGADRTASQTGRGIQKGSYCTQKCLLGLVRGGLLDPSCPNAQSHVGRLSSDRQRKHHPIDSQAFCTRIRRQLSEDLDVDCYPEGAYGACGALFRVRLRSHGYTVAAKTIPIESVRRLEREAAFYQQLRRIQGITIPVHLGNIDLDVPYFWHGIQLVHMMFLSFGGNPLSQHDITGSGASITQQKADAERAFRENGVLHEDLAQRNILWNEENKRIMIIDFERAKVIRPRTALGSISVNRKRTWESIDDEPPKQAWAVQCAAKVAVGF